MIYKLILLFSAFSYANAFGLTSKPNTDFKYVGDTKPLGYFDPFQLTSNSPESLIKYVREGELQHGRISMLAFITMMTSEIMDDSKLAIYNLSSLDLNNQLPFWLSMGIFETYRMIIGWQNPFNKTGKEFKLNYDYQPGNVFNLDSDKYDSQLLEKELNNGRLAMIGVLGFIVQELTTNQPIF